MTTQGRVLIIDDDAEIRHFVTTLLELNGFEVTAVGDGIDALDIREEFVAILLDLHMPVFDGERLLAYWQMTNPPLLHRVIVMTGYPRRKWNATAMPFAIVEKPFRPEDIVRAVRGCAARAQSLELGSLDAGT